MAVPCCAARWSRRASHATRKLWPGWQPGGTRTSTCACRASPSLPGTVTHWGNCTRNTHSGITPQGVRTITKGWSSSAATARRLAAGGAGRPPSSSVRFLARMCSKSASSSVSSECCESGDNGEPGDNAFCSAILYMLPGLNASARIGFHAQISHSAEIALVLPPTCTGFHTRYNCTTGRDLPQMCSV